MRLRRWILTALLGLLVVLGGCYRGDPYRGVSSYSSQPFSYYGKGYYGYYGHADYYRPSSAYGYHSRPYGYRAPGYDHGHYGTGYRHGHRGQHSRPGSTGTRGR